MTTSDIDSQSKPVKTDKSHTNLLKHASAIHSCSNSYVNFNECLLISKVLNLRNVNVYSLVYAIETLREVSFLVKDIRILGDIYNICCRLLLKKQELQKSFPSVAVNTDKRCHFKVTVEKFNENPILGLYTGVHTVDISSQNITHEIRLTHFCYLAILFEIIKLNEYSDVNHLFHFSNGIRMLTSTPSWKKISDKCITSEQPQNFLSFLADSSILFNDVDSIKNSHQKSLLKKCQSVLSEIQDFVQSPGDGKTDRKAPIADDLTDIKKHFSIKDDVDAHDTVIEEKEGATFLESLALKTHASEAHYLINTWQTLTSSEILSVENFIHTNTNDFTFDDEELLSRQTILGFNLYFGIPLTQVFKINIGSPGLTAVNNNDKRNKIYVDPISGIIYLPSAYLSIDSHHINQLTEEYTLLPLPLRLIELIKKFNFHQNTTLGDLLSIGISEANKLKYLPNYKQYRFSSEKITSTLWTNIFSICHDEVKVSYLQGGSFKHQPMGIYYTQLNTNELIDLYKTSFEKIFPNTPLHKLKMKYNAAHIGSPFAPALDNVTRFFENKYQLLETLKKNKFDDKSFITFHNEYSLYVLSILNVTSTHRVVSDPYFSEEIFIDNFCQITDKELGPGYEGRLSALGDLALEQIKEYLKYRNWLFCHNPLVEGSLQSKNPRNRIPLFFLIKENTCHSISKKEITEYTNSVEGIALVNNFHRHLFSSYAAKQKLPRIFISAQMGHISKGQSIFGQTSIISPRELYLAVTPVINRLCSELEIKPSFAPFHRKELPSLEHISFHKGPVGPFKRLLSGEIKLDQDDIQLLNIRLCNAPNVDKNLYIDLKTQELWASKIYKIKKFSSNVFKILNKYLKHHRQNSQWRYQLKSNLERSPFNKNFGRLFHQAIELQKESENFIDLCIKKNGSVVELKTALVLSLIYNAKQFSKKHLEKFLDIPHQEVLDLPLTTAFTIEPKALARKTFFLDETSLYIYSLATKDIKETDHVKVSFQQASNVLKKSVITINPNIDKHIQASITLSRLDTPGYLIQHSKDELSNHSLSKEGWLRLFNLESLFKRFDNPYSRTSFDNPKRHSGQDNIISSIKNAFKECDSDKYSELLSKFNDINPSPKAPSSEILLLQWVKHCAENKLIDIPSIKTYFAKIHKSVTKVFKNINILDLDEDDLIEHFYPKIFNDMKLHSRSESIFTSELGSFHKFLSSEYGFAEFKFFRKRNKPIIRSNSSEIVTYVDYQNALSFILKDKNLNTFHKHSLALCLIFYYRFGLRASEVIKLRLIDYSEKDKLLQIVSNEYGKEKSRYGNRLADMDLLNKFEIELFDSFLGNRHQSCASNNGYLLFPEAIGINLVELTGKVRKYITTIIRESSKNDYLNLKSFRKSFASYTILNIQLSETSSIARKELNLSNASKLTTNYIDNKFFRKKEASYNRLWAIAKIIGHSDPNTSLSHYCHITDLLVFDHAINNRATNKNPNPYLKALLDEKLKHKQSLNAYGNAKKRHKAEAFTYLYKNHLIKNELSPYQPTMLKSINESFEISIDTVKIIRQILALFYSIKTSKSNENISNIMFVDEQLVKQYLDNFTKALESLLVGKLKDRCIEKIIDQVIPLKRIEVNFFKKIQTSNASKEFMELMRKDHNKSFFEGLHLEWKHNFLGFESGLIIRNQSVLRSLIIFLNKNGLTEQVELTLNYSEGNYTSIDYSPLMGLFPFKIKHHSKNGHSYQSSLYFELKFIKAKGEKKKSYKTEVNTLHECMLYFGLM